MNSSMRRVLIQENGLGIGIGITVFRTWGDRIAISLWETLLIGALFFPSFHAIPPGQS